MPVDVHPRLRGATILRPEVGLGTRCGGCGAENELPTSIVAQTTPRARSRARSGELFRCAACGGALEPEMLLWTDLDRLEYAVVLPAARAPEGADLEQRVTERFAATFLREPQDVWEDPAQVAVRVVFGVAALQEKLITSDAGLDDRVLEALKAALIASPTGRRFGLTELRLTDVTASGELVFAGPGLPEPLVVAAAAYVALHARREGLAKDLPELFRGAWVDLARYGGALPASVGG
jgi:hypothetical protein